MIVTSILSLRRQTRTGYPCDFDYAEFLVDGTPLLKLIRRQYPNLDDIGCLGWGPQDLQREKIDRLLLTGEADFPEGRRSLYVCPACGDLGCGAVSVRIERAKRRFVWRDFGLQHEGFAEATMSRCEGIGPYYFEEQAYAETIRSAYGLGGFHWPNPKSE